MTNTTAAVSLLAALLLATTASAQQHATRALNSDEVSRSARAAMIDVDTPVSTTSGATSPSQNSSRLNVSRRALSTASQSSANAGSVPRHHMLLTERRPATKGDSKRLADVYIYDYRAETLIHRIVDTNTDQVLFRSSSRGQQLPLTANESERAVAALFADPLARNAVSAAHRRITGSRLDDLSTVLHKAVVFVADAAMGTRGDSASCGAVRCAQILLYTAGEQIAIDLRPVVRLADNKVIAVDQIVSTGHGH